MPINDYRCINCGFMLCDTYGKPNPCSCGSEFEVVFSVAPQVCFKISSVVDKIDEINNKKRAEINEQDYYSPLIKGRI